MIKRITSIALSVIVLSISACKKEDNDPKYEYYELTAMQWQERLLIGKNTTGGYDTINSANIYNAFTRRHSPIVASWMENWMYYIAVVKTDATLDSFAQEYKAHLFKGDYENSERVGGEVIIRTRFYKLDGSNWIGQMQSITADFPPFNVNVDGGYYESYR